NVSSTCVLDGSLLITARSQSYQGSAFTSGRINTMNKVSVYLGYIAARVKYNATNGLWPAVSERETEIQTIFSDHRSSFSSLIILSLTLPSIAQHLEFSHFH